MELLKSFLLACGIVGFMVLIIWLDPSGVLFLVTLCVVILTIGIHVISLLYKEE